MAALREKIQQELARNSTSVPGVWNRAKTFFTDLTPATVCESPLCVGVAVFLITLVVLVVLQPPMIRRRSSVTGQEYLSKPGLLFFAAVVGLSVPVVCHLMCQPGESV